MKRVFKGALLLLLCYALLICSHAASNSAYDVNDDGKIGLLDVITVVRLSVSAEPDTKGDINGDGTVTIEDALLVLKQLLNKKGVVYTYMDIVERLTDTRYLSLGNTDEESELFSSYARKSQYTDGAYVNWRDNGDGSNVIGTMKTAAI